MFASAGSAAQVHLYSVYNGRGNKYMRVVPTSIEAGALFVDYVKRFEQKGRPTNPYSGVQDPIVIACCLGAPQGT